MSGRQRHVMVSTSKPIKNTELWLSLGIAGCIESGCDVEFKIVLYDGGDSMILIVLHNGSEYVMQDPPADKDAEVDMGVQLVRFCQSRHLLDAVMGGARVLGMIDGVPPPGALTGEGRG